MRRGKRWEEEIARHSGTGRLRQGDHTFPASYLVRTLQECWERPAINAQLEPGRGTIRSTGLLTLLDESVGLEVHKPIYLCPDGGSEVEVLFSGRLAIPIRSARFVVNGDWQAAVEKGA